MTTIWQAIMCRCILLTVCLGIGWDQCIAQENDAGSEEYIPTAEELAWEQWGNAALLDMANSQTPWMRAALAAHFATRKDPELATIGHEKFEAIALLPTTDPLTLWHLARYCSAYKESTTCKEQHIIERLGQSDSKNIAALLVVDQYRSGENWLTPDAQSPESQALLKNLADTEVFDEFWGRGSSELLEGIEEYSRQNPPPKTPDLVRILNLDPYFLLISPVILMDGFSPGYSKLLKLCEKQAETKNQEATNQCLKISQILQLTSKTLLSKSMGLAIEANVESSLNPDSPQTLFAERKRAVLRKAQLCTMPRFMQGHSKTNLDEAVIKAWTAEYILDLDQLGEITAMQLAAEREYAKYPDQYPSDPRDCPDVMTMSSSEMAELLGDNDPALTFDTPQ